ncbi:MAG: PKD domain-containing protein [Longimicrobiales bacterium]
MKRLFLSLAFGVLASGVLWACSDGGEIGSPLSVDLTGPATGLAGEELPFMYDVEGRSLAGIIFEWGDGSRDSVPTAGAQTAMGTRLHTFDSVGVYLVNMVVEDAVEGVQSASVSVDVLSN